MTFLEESSENILWIKSHLAGVHNNPKHSNYTKENNCNVIDIIGEQLSKFFSSDFNFIGDNFIIESENDLAYLPQDYEIDSITSIRNNQDISINDYGQ